MDFKELSNDPDIINRLKQFSKAINDIEKILQLVSDPQLYDKLTNTDKIKYNLMVSFALNSLFWMHLRAEGVDPMKHPIRGENDRLKRAMARAQEIKDRLTIMPRLNKDAAKRFIRNGLWVPNDTCEDDNAGEDVNEEENWEIVHPDQSTSDEPTNNV